MKTVKRRLMKGLRAGLGLCLLGALCLSLGQAQASSVKKRYIVHFKPGKTAHSALRAARAALHVANLPSSRSDSRAHAVSVDASGLRTLMSRSEVDFVEEDAKRYPLSTEVTPWGITAVETLSPAATASGTAMVCIIDSGYSLAHPDLPQSVTASPNSGTGDPFTDGCGHGTHVAGTIAALKNNQGVVGIDSNSGIHIHVVKVFSDSCAWTYSSSLVTALSKCQEAARLAKKKLVINMSLGGSTKSRSEESAFSKSAQAGHIAVAAAGNNGTTRFSYPASYSSVISVAAVDSKLKVASFSQRNSAVDLSAPGVDVLSTVPTFSEASVTTSTGLKTFGSELTYSEQTTTSGVGGTFVSGGLCTSQSASFQGAIVLCERGSISFADKALNAQAGGALGVVIYNNVSGSFSGTLGSATTGVTIPVIGMTREDGLLLLAETSKSVSATLINATDSTQGGYAKYSGTSMATPHVAAAAASLWNAVPHATAAAVRSALEKTATDLGASGRDDSYGFGLINLPRALQHLQASPTKAGGYSPAAGM